MVHEVLELVGLLVVAGAGPVDLVDLIDDDKAGPQVSHKLARLVGECRLVGPGSVRRAEEIQQLGGQGLGMLGGRHGDVHDRYRIGHLRIPSSVGLFDGTAERPDGSTFPDAGHAAEDHPARCAELLPAVEPHEEQALSHCAVEDRGLQRGQRRVVVAALVVVRESLCRGKAAKLGLGEQGDRLGIMLHECAPAVQSGDHTGCETPGLYRRHGTSPGLNTSYAPCSEDWADSAFSYASSSGSGVVAGSSSASVCGRTGRLASTATALASSGFRSWP